MTRSQAKEMAKKYGMEILREPITNLGYGLYMRSADLIPELDAFAENVSANAATACLRTCDGVDYLYRIYCPESWFDLWGWADE